ncbi:MAG TPA: hypothetical protein VF912_18345 [Anaeromyxobacter sp.]
MGPPRDLAIRPLGLGEIIDRSVALTLRHFRTLFAAMLVIEAPALALGRLQQARAGEVLALLGDPARATAAFPSLTGFFGALLLSLLVLQLAATAAAAAIVAPSLDPAAPPGPSGLRRALAVVTATIVQVAALVLAPAFGALPGLLLAARAETFATQVVAIVAAALGAVVLFLLVLLRLVLVPAVAAVEGRGAFRAALRSARLMAPARGGRFLDRPALRASLVLLAIFLLAVAANGVAGLPRIVAARLAGGEGPVGLLGATLPLPLEVAISIFEAAAAAALQPFSLVAVAVLYFDRRARTEALDVEIWAARLEGGR